MLLQKSYCFQFVFETLDISQGSIATHLRCGGIFSDRIITNFLPILKVLIFVNLLIFDKTERREFTGFTSSRLG